MKHTVWEIEKESCPDCGSVMASSHEGTICHGCDGMVPDAAIVVGAEKGRTKMKFHTDSSCRYLNNCNKYREPQENEIEWHDAEHCSVCVSLRKV